MLHKHAHIQQSEFVNTYSAYMNEFRVAMQTLAKYEQSSLEFKQLLLKCQHTCGCKGLSLSAYLLTPIQRLPRYELLLKVRPSDISDTQHERHIMVLFQLASAAITHQTSPTSLTGAPEAHSTEPP